MEDEGTDIPRFSYDLIDLLDETFPIPQMPTTMAAWGIVDHQKMLQMAFAAGSRSVVDGLIQMRQEQEEAHGAPEESDDPLSEKSVLGGGRPDLHIRTVAIAGFEGLDTREAGPLPGKDRLEE